MQRKEFSEYAVGVEGLAPLLVDPFISMDQKTQPPNSKRVYLTAKNEVMLPAANVMSFLCGQKRGCAQRFEDKKLKNEMAQMVLATVRIAPEEIVICRDGKPIVLGDSAKFDTLGTDGKSGLRIVEHKAVVMKGPQAIPCPKKRVQIDLPWSAEIKVTLFNLPGNVVTEDVLRKWFRLGGLCIGFGTYRPVYGRFAVTSFA